MSKFHIRPEETLIEALRRHLNREPSYEDVILSFGGRFTGGSQIEHDRNPTSRSEDDGVRSQT